MKINSIKKEKNRFAKLETMINVLLEETPKEELFTALMLATAFGKILTREEVQNILDRLAVADEKIMEALFYASKASLLLAYKIHGNPSRS
jgi:hypothetical protein